jgi:Asp-tRNA(Asn)/Glu-tRNA(Gln) amidotransferase A subunit family amidase
MLPAFQVLVDGFLAPTTGSTGWSRGGSRAIPATAALVTVRGEPVGAWALRVRIQGRPQGPLTGRTLAVKDNIAVAGVSMRKG